MKLKWIIWSVFCNCVSGAVIQRIRKYEMGNNTENTINPSYDDYDTNYPDYTDRDYPNLDYYDDNREGRTLNHNHDNPLDDNENFDEQDAEDFMMKQLKSTIPGTPGIDYALYQSVPETTFRCKMQTSPGFYGDVEAQCQVFHICQDDDRQDSFLCPLGTVFNQQSFICDWWFNFNCEDTPTFYNLNNKYDSITGSTLMKDTMRKMRSLHNKGMMGLAKTNKQTRNMKNIMGNTNFMNLSKSPIKNLFMLGMRKKKFESIRNTKSSKREVGHFATALPIVRTPLSLQAMSSTGNFDITFSENATNTSLIDSHGQSLLKTKDDSKKNNNTSDGSSITVLPTYDSPFESLNSSGKEMIINGSTVGEIKLDNIEIDHIEMTPSSKSQSATNDTNIPVKTENISLPEVKAKRNDNEYNEFDDDYNSEIETGYPVNLSTESSINKTVEDYNLQLNDTLDEQSRSTLLPLSKPFSHENKFIIGNDTHISVSVTIHSKSGNSKLLWKRLPGLKRIRKVRIKDEKDTSIFEKNATNDTIYRKKNTEKKSRSRIMWTPAKRNILDRKLDWKRLFESRIANIEGIARNETKHFEALEDLKKAALRSNETPQTNIRNAAHNSLDKRTLLVNKLVATQTAEETSTIEATKDTDNDFSYITENSLQSFNETVDFSSNSNQKNISEIQIETKGNLSALSENEDNCKTICIKLLKSLNRTLRHNIGNNTDFENFPSSMFLTTESSYAQNQETSIQNQDEYERKSILEFSPSEQWTLKYDSGPNCNENTEKDKILVKGWSVIIDIGSLTKEKTVKRKSCSSSSVDKKIFFRNFNFDKNSQDEEYNPKASHFVINSNSRMGSADQRYWLNLVKNWLSQSQFNKNQENNYMKRNENQNVFSNDKQIDYKNEDLKNSKDHDKAKIKSENLQAILPQRYQINFNQNSDLNSEVENKRTRSKNSGQDILIPEYNRRRRQQDTEDPVPKWFPDLQTERSEWSQATQTRKDWPDSTTNKQSSNIYSMRDVISDEVDEDEDRITKDRTEGSDNFKNSYTNQNLWLSEYETSERKSNTPSEWTDKTNADADQDYDDWSLQERIAKIYQKKNYGDEEADTKSEEWNWSKNEQQNKKNTMSLPDRNIWNAESSSDWSNDKSTVANNPDKGFQSNFADKGNDWLFKNTNRQSSDRDNQRSTPWQQEERFSDELNTPQSTKSMSDIKGRSIRNERREPKNEFKDHSMKTNQRNGWSFMKSHDTNWSVSKQTPKRNDRRSDSEFPSSKGQHFQTSKNDKKFRSVNEGNNRRIDSELKWRNQNQKGNDENRKPRVGQADDAMKGRGQWYTEESAWNWEERNNDKPQNQEWNPKGMPNNKGNTSPRMNNKPNVPDWSLQPKVHQNKGDAMKKIDIPMKSLQKYPRRPYDEEKDMWSAKSPRAETWPPDTSLQRMNFKGNSDAKKPRATLTSEKPWNSDNRNDRNKGRDEEIWSSDFPLNKPQHKPDEGISSKNKMSHSQWKSDFIDDTERLEANRKQTQNQNIPSNLKGGDFLHGSSRSIDDDDDIAKRKVTDWKNQYWKDSITLKKDIKVEDRHPYQLHENYNFQRNGKVDTASWSMHRQTDSMLSGYGRASQKPNINNHWSSSKDNKGGRIPQSSSQHTIDQRKAQPRRNSARNQSGLKNKNIMWSIQIGDDGKLANGWIPITLCPDIKSQLNSSQTNRNNKRTSLKDSDWDVNDENTDDEEKSDRDKVWNYEEYLSKQETQEMSSFTKDRNRDSRRKSQINKGSSSVDNNRNIKKNDWSSEDSFPSDDHWTFKGLKINKQNSKVSKNYQNVQINKNADAIEKSPFYIHTPEESFNHLIYIPPKNIREKRSNKHSDKKVEAIDVTNKSYVIIKSGKILDNSFENGNRTFTSQSVKGGQNDRKQYDANLSTQISFPYTARAKQNSSRFDLNNSEILKSTKTFQNDDIYETNSKHDTITRESIKEVWSSPFTATNFSASGWIPVTTFKSVTNKYTLNLNNDDKIINVTQFQAKTNKSNSSTLANIQATEYFTAEDASKKFSVVTKDYGTDKEINENKNGSSIVKMENIKEMKVGNKTLRILSFSDVMKRFQNQVDKPAEDDKSEDSLRNTPITNSKTYSVTYDNPINETANNFNNSWVFPLNESNANKSWILIKSGDDLNENTKEYSDKENSNKESIEKSELSENMRIQLSNSTLNFITNKTQSNQVPEFKFTNWNANSDWTPIITTIGRVVSFNRTLLPR